MRGQNSSGANLLFGSRKSSKIDKNDPVIVKANLEVSFDQMSSADFWKKGWQTESLRDMTGKNFKEIDYIASKDIYDKASNTMSTLRVLQGREMKRLSENIALLGKFDFDPVGSRVKRFSLFFATSKIDNTDLNLEAGSMIVGWFDDHKLTSLILKQVEGSKNIDVVAELDNQAAYFSSQGYKPLNFDAKEIRAAVIEKALSL